MLINNIEWSEQQLGFVIRVLKCFDLFDNCNFDRLSWRMDGKYTPITFLLDCSDSFWWGTSDCERLTPENIHIYEQSIKDIAEIGAEWYGYNILLFCARVRKMRPARWEYNKQWPEPFKKLFDDCGPERTSQEEG